MNNFENVTIARDLWKKKYFNEKKKTPQLEERMNALLKEIEQCQQKMFHSLESDIRNAASIGYNRESEAKNNWLVSLRLQEEIYLLRRHLDQQKLKLTTDIKVGFRLVSEIMGVFLMFLIFLAEKSSRK